MPRLEITDWMMDRNKPEIGIGVEQLQRRPTYGFVDRSQQRVNLYTPFATVYPGREHNYQEDLIEAALLHLRHAVSGKPAQISFPYHLKPYVKSDHLSLLAPDSPDVRDFRKAKVRIFVKEEQGVEDIFESFGIPDSLRQ